jgi:hypothetical protein
MKVFRKSWARRGLCLSMLLLLLITPSISLSATDTGSGMYLETLGTKLFLMAKNVVVPLLLIGLVLFCGANVAFGFVQIGPGVGRMLFGAAIILGGIETLLLMLGGTAATALVF